MALCRGLLKIFRRIIFLNFCYGWPRIYEAQATFIAFHNFEKFLGEETPVGHFINEGVPLRTAQITRDILHGRGLYLSAFERVHPVKEMK